MFGDGALRAVLDAVEAIRQTAAHVAAQHLRLHDAPAELAHLLGAVPARVGANPVGELLDRLAVAGDAAELAGLPIVADDGHRQRPALPRVADHVGGGHAGPPEHAPPETIAEDLDHLKPARPAPARV